MKTYFCLIPKEDYEDPKNTGWKYAKDHESEWIDTSSVFPENIPNSNYNHYTNFFVKNNKVYDIVKMYADVTRGATIHLCYENVNGCEQI